jgi:hypothetical protein
MKEKLYLGRYDLTTMFTSTDTDYSLVSTALWALKEEAKTNSFKEKNLSSIEITKVEDIPVSWRGAYVWGPKEDLTPEEFLHLQGMDPEYHEYLRLKKKFEDTNVTIH